MSTQDAYCVRSQADRTVRRLKAEQDDIDNPSIMDYIRLKHDVSELEKQVHQMLNCAWL